MRAPLISRLFEISKIWESKSLTIILHRRILSGTFFTPFTKDVQAVRKGISFLEATLQKVERQESKFKAALAQYQKLQEQAKSVDAARQSIRPDMDREAYRHAREIYGKWYDSDFIEQSHREVAAMLGEEERQASIRQQIGENHAKRSPHEKPETMR